MATQLNANMGSQRVAQMREASELTPEQGLFETKDNIVKMII